MNTLVTLDKLLEKSNGSTLYFDGETCPVSLLLEAILRGLQIRNQNEDYVTGGGRGCGFGYVEMWGFGEGAGFTVGFGEDVEGFYNISDGTGSGWGGSGGSSVYLNGAGESLGFGHEGSCNYYCISMKDLYYIP